MTILQAIIFLRIRGDTGLHKMELGEAKEIVLICNFRRVISCIIRQLLQESMIWHRLKDWRFLNLWVFELETALPCERPLLLEVLIVSGVLEENVLFRNRVIDCD